MALFGVGREEAGLRNQKLDLNISRVDQLGGETSRNFEFFSLLEIDYERAEHGLELAKLCLVERFRCLEAFVPDIGQRPILGDEGIESVIAFSI